MNPLFIIGAPRSCTTFFSHILNDSELFAVWMEPNFIWKYNNGKIKFDGIDGKFFFLNNIVSRELNIFEIQKQGTPLKNALIVCNGNPPRKSYFPNYGEKRPIM